MLSTPTPPRTTTCRLEPASSTGFLTFVRLRTTIAWYSGITSSSFSGVIVSMTSTCNPALRIESQAQEEIGSQTSTFIIVVLLLQAQDIVDLCRDPRHVFHRQVAHVGDAEALSLEGPIAIGDHRAALAKRLVQRRPVDAARVLDVAHRIREVALVTEHGEVLARPGARVFRPSPGGGRSGSRSLRPACSPSACSGRTGG